MGVSEALRGAARVLAKALRLPARPVDPDTRFEREQGSYHRAEESRFRHVANDAAYLNQPFSDLKLAPLHLYRVGLVLSALELGPQDEVLDFGAGTCWLSAMLNRMGIKTVSVDISPTALQLGRRAFALDERQRLDLEPEFHTYDGHRLPFANGRFDAVVCYDAFHHLANQEEILAEMHRVTKRRGRVVFCEPLSGHRAGSLAMREMEAFGVLERDVDLAQLERAALRIGFARLVLKPYAQDPDDEQVGNSLARNLALGLEQAAKRYLDNYAVFYLRRSADDHHDSAHPNRLVAEISVAGSRLDGPPGGEIPVAVTVRNAGDTTWLAAPHPRGGYVTFGAQLLDRDKRLLDRDYQRVRLDRDVAPGAAWSCETVVRAPVEPGDYFLKLDLVDEQVCWFEEMGSKAVLVSLAVR